MLSGLDRHLGPGGSVKLESACFGNHLILCINYGNSSSAIFRQLSGRIVCDNYMHNCVTKFSNNSSNNPGGRDAKTSRWKQRSSESL